MPGDPSRRQTPAWRNQGGPGERKKGAQPAWRKDEVAPHKARRLSRPTKFGIGLALCLLLVGGLAWLVSLLKPPTLAGLVVVGAGYEENLAVPPNVYGWIGARDLADWCSGKVAASWLERLTGKTSMQLVGEPVHLTDPQGWEPQRWKSFSGKTLVVLVALHGGTDRDGAFLWADDPEGKKRLRLGEMIDSLGDVTKAGKNVVLVLDATQVDSDWSAGMLHNDFARQLEQLEPKIAEQRRLVVFSASGPGQRSWVSEEWRRSIFTHYLLEGLRGAAPPDRAGAITVKQLVEYVTDKVDRWAQDNRAAEQKPELLPRKDGLTLAQDWTLIASGRDRQPETDPGEAPGDDYKTPAADLAAAKVWADHDGLRGSFPAPAVYAPHTWRLYEATLLRYEQLVRAGDAGHAGDLKGKLARLQGDLAAEAGLQLTRSRGRSLALGVLAGKAEGGAPDALVGETFRQLWTGNDTQRDAAWREARKGHDEDALRLALADRLLKEVGQPRSGPADFEKAHDVLRVLDQGGNSRPVEAHVLALLGRDLQERERYQQPAPPADDLRLALDVCRLAEETALSGHAVPLGESRAPLYAYSEYVYPWISTDLEAADKVRRHGEDLLFASDAGPLAEAHKELEAARSAYRQIQGHADAVRKALAVYHEARAWLPWYAGYLARSSETTSEDLQQAQQLAELTDRLADLLEDPKAGGNALKDAADRAATAFQKVQERFAGHCQTLAKQPPKTQSGWYELEALLTVPSIDEATRLALVRNSREVSRELNRNTAKQGEHAPPTAHPFEDARRQGRMALAVLGRSWVQACSGKDLGAFDRLDQKLAEARADDWDALDAAGRQIGECWQALAPTVEQDSAGPEDQKSEDAVKGVRRAERLARQLDGGAAYVLYEVHKQHPDPVAERRRLLLQGLLRGLAERARLDHWWGEEQDKTPYYVVTGTSYLQDAEDLLPQQHPALKDEDARQLLEQKKALTAVGLKVTTPPDGRLSMTDQPHFQPQFGLVANPQVPRGDLVCWAEMKGPLEEAGKPKGRLVQRVGDPLPEYEMTWLDGSPSVKECAITLHVRYRGQALDPRVEVVTPGAPNRKVYQYPPSPTAKVMVQADPEVYNQKAWEQMRIAIVFDHSLSMEVDENNKPSSKLTEATQALQDVLSQLPEGPTVSLWTFGHRSLETEREPAERLEKVDHWDANPDVARKWRDRLRDIHGSATALSPILHTMVRAAEQDLGLKREDRPREDEDADKAGVKVLLVLTDGDDNVFEKLYGGKSYESYNPGHKFKTKEYLQQRFNGSDVKILMVGFQLEGDEKASAEAQFGDLPKLKPQPGEFLEAANKARLKQLLSRILERQDLRCKVRRYRDNRFMRLSDDLDGALSVSHTDEDLIPSAPLPPDAYVARVPAVGPQHFVLEKGDLLLLDVKNKGLERALFKDYHERHLSRPLPSKDKGGWLVTAHESRIDLNGRSRKMLLSAEKESGRSGGDLQQIKPGFVWFDLAADGGKGEPAGLSWGNVGDVLGYPAPAWELRVREWPKGAVPRVRAWVLDRKPGRDPDLSVSFTHGKGDPPDTFVQSEARPGNDPVTGIKVTFEEMTVPARPDEKETKRPCLVVRAKYPPGSPVVAQLEGLGLGAEHRFYTGVNQYTGIFWPIDPEVARQSNFTLSLISLKAIQSPDPIEFPVKERDLAPPDKVQLDPFDTQGGR